MMNSHRHRHQKVYSQPLEHTLPPQLQLQAVKLRMSKSSLITRDAERKAETVLMKPQHSASIS